MEMKQDAVSAFEEFCASTPEYRETLLMAALVKSSISSFLYHLGKGG